jgi:hypothetical protein
MRKIVLLLGTLALTDCAASPEAIYLRTDGQDMTGNPALREQLDRDRLACEGDPDCMAVKGYVAVSKDRAAAKQQQLATIAAQNVQREAVAVLPLPKKPLKTAIKKHKSNPPRSP